MRSHTSGPGNHTDHARGWVADQRRALAPIARDICGVLAEQSRPQIG